eukprot:CAMPEP_0198341168 /NCGR_PEP_ID=MMETSP1450-20131203/46691_1 /TAXON_ID=753684 ORGANISM="Madagascaria erythrocladiodes, Strain CCMP3234" /NCGR_SAMPLE_ID=MMETSP1450 /ASSEMBLY_ACC=CAM_ASM_001115 /LENGTH=495 /DNA_ID=CAMNT_0044046177 /DNA_START=84 /DNA_END=1571 /DNA_ORIENTATION=+
MTSKIGVYIVSTTLGHGTFGKVKLARNSETGVEYAMKILDKSDIRMNDLTASVRREISIMKALKHKNIVNLVEVLSSKTKLYIVMGLVRGGELFDLIDKHGGFSESVARKYFHQLVDGVEYCHRQDVCHRDLKPENLLVDYDGNLKITDFGVSSMKKNTTLLYTNCGTPYYAAPEILANSGDGYDGRKADVWSCGVILYLLLCGQLPWENEDDMGRLFEEIKRAKFPFPPEISEGARDLISNMMAREPTLRFDLSEVKNHAWFLVDYKGSQSDIGSEILSDALGQKPKKISSRLRRPGPLFGRNRSKEDKLANGGSPEMRVFEGTSRRHSVHDVESGRGFGKSPSASDVSTQSGVSGRSGVSSINPGTSREQVNSPATPYDLQVSPVRDADVHQLDAGASQNLSAVPQLKRPPKDLSAEFKGRTISDFVGEALPGKPDHKIAEVVERLERIDIDCIDDIQTVAEFMEDSVRFREWLEERQVPAVTCIRIAKMFFE